MNSQIKILLADESAVFLEQLRHVLERDPAFVIAGSANDAQRAVELLHRTQPDILILGLLLPERDGVSVLTAANALPRPPMTLALTGALTEQDAQKLETLGVRYMIRKPCKLQVVAACVIGGISTMGGSGRVLGCLCGALFLGVINNALPVIGISPFWQMAISGAVIVMAVLLNERGNRGHGRLILRNAALARQKQAVKS